jgi:hypothetical protein
MNAHIRYFLLALFFGSKICDTSGQTDLQYLNVQVPDTLDFFNMDGNMTAYYELFLTNVSTDTINLQKIGISDIADSSPFFISEMQDLQNRFNKIGSDFEEPTLQLLPGQASVIYLELSLPIKQSKEITHHIGFEIAGVENSRELAFQTLTTTCSSNTPIVLGAPLKGGIWTSIYEPSWERGHRRVMYTVDGKARIPGRYAIDFVKVDSIGKYAMDDDDIIKNWLGYGVNVLAVADGVVSSVSDEFSESATLSGHPEYSENQATGNYISIKIGDNQFAFYEHLKPNSIKVKVGQKVKKGDIIALIGFTGQTTGPHLHFHLADADAPLGAEGIPFVFENFKYLGSYKNLANFGMAKWEFINDLDQQNRRAERPIPNAVVAFDPDE